MGGVVLTRSEAVAARDQMRALGYALVEACGTREEAARVAARHGWEPGAALTALEALHAALRERSA